jgi:hypothetical protein
MLVFFRICISCLAGQVTYYEWLPAVAGYPMRPWKTYDPEVIPVVNDFVAVAGLKFTDSEVNSCECV